MVGLVRVSQSWNVLGLIVSVCDWLVTWYSICLMTLGALWVAIAQYRNLIGL